MSTAIVVGAGPTGSPPPSPSPGQGVQVTVLEAADEIGGGTRTSEAIVPGLLHDHCSAIHPMAVGSPFLAGLGLDRYGLHWRLPEIDCVHPLDGGGAGVLHRSVDDTAAGLGADGAPVAAAVRTGRRPSYDALAEDIMGPLLRVPAASADAGPVRRAHGAAGVRCSPGVFRTEEARALFGGVAAHAFRPLHCPLTSAIGLGHPHRRTPARLGRWPRAARGRSPTRWPRCSPTSAARSRPACGSRRRRSCRPPTSPCSTWRRRAVADILGDRLPPPSRPRLPAVPARARARSRSTSRSRAACPGPTAAARRAGTVHLGGTFAEIAATEREIHAGRMPERPFVLVGQQYLADPQRSVGDIHPVWTLRARAARLHRRRHRGDHRPDRAVRARASATGSSARRSAPPRRWPTYNPNYVGGDIITGAKDIRQLVFGPRDHAVALRRSAFPGMYICSAATPPGPGAHGMCGANAADVALSELT